MTFINQYSEHISYIYSKEFLENGNSFVYALGKSKNKASTICKIDIDGNIIWERTYFLEIQEAVSFEKIIQLKANKEKKALGLQYIIYAKSEKNNYLISINSNGDVIWFKIISWEFENFDLFIDPLSQYDSKYGFNILLSNKLGQNYHAIVDSSGNFIFGNDLLSKVLFRVKSISSHNKGLAVAGETIDKSSQGVVFDIHGTDQRLTVNNAQIINSNLNIHDLQFDYENGREYYISGYLNKEQKLFIGNINRNTTFKLFPKTDLQRSKIELSNSGIYLLQIDRFNGKLDFLDLDLGLNWKRNLFFESKESYLNSFTFNQNTNSITAVTTGLEYATIVHTNSEFESCKTSNVNQEMAAINIKATAFEISLKEKSIALETQKIEILSLKSDKYELCSIDSGDGSDEDTSSHDFVVAPHSELQSSHIYMQAAGSLGNDGSVKGIHLRWMFKNYLGENHLPKGNYASTQNHFNKENDFVKIYRAPYISNEKTAITLDFSKPASTVDSSNYLWMYLIEGKQFYVYFRNHVTYNNTLSRIDPTLDPMAFITAYGVQLIEVEHKTELSYNVAINSTTDTAEIRIESFSVDTNILTATKYLSSRKILRGGSGKIEEENIRSIRYTATGGVVKSIKFELYSKTLNEIKNTLEYIGSFSLTQNDNIAINRLEHNGDVNGNWLRFNGDDKINTANYVDRWNGDQEYPYGNQTEYYEYFDRNLKTIVKRYIELSDLEVEKPKGEEGIPFSEINPDDATQDDFTDIFNIDILNMSAIDFHTARILGLGHIDSSFNVNTNNKYFYLAEYTTLANISTGTLVDAVEMQHLYLSLPTSINEQRLPYPLDLKEPKCGIVREYPLEMSCSSGSNETNGYSEDGKQRFISLFLDELPENSIDVDFFTEDTIFSTSQKTIPVFAGIEYKKIGESQWLRPELSNTNEYKNYPGTSSSVNETVPLFLPEPNKVLFIHRERENGEHVYGSYGVNWFSRSQESEVTWNVETILKPQNRLLPPSNVKAALIIEESPLLLSSAEEQDLFEEIVDTDKTLIRLTFDHNIVQDLITYQINEESMGSYTFAQIGDNSFDNSNDEYNQSIFPDDKEIFAEEIEIFFRDKTPRAVSGQIKQILPNANGVFMDILTEKYHQVSNNTDIIPEIPEDEYPNFVGSIFMFNGDKYIVYQVETTGVSGEGPKFTVYKKEVSESMLNGTDLDSDAELTIPTINGSVLFNTIENMVTETNWGSSNPFSYKIQIGYNQIHREVVEDENTSDVIEQVLEKTRGFWYDANIEPVYQEREVYDANGNLQYQTGANGYPELITENVHLGMYKIVSNQLGNLVLENHPQFEKDANEPEKNYYVNWHKGIVRIHTLENPLRKRRVLEVVKIENIGSSVDNLVLYVFDQGFLDMGEDEDGNAIRLNEQILTGSDIEVNLYPSYKVYFYKDTNHHLTKDHILPLSGEGMKYTIFGLRTIDHLDPVVYDIPIYKSKISTPSVMFAQEIIAPMQPLLTIPDQFIYATRPDTFGRSTFTLKPTFAHEPHGVIFYRTNEYAILNALYKQETVNTIIADLKEAETDGLTVNRWQTFLQFDFNTVNYPFPNPDKRALYQMINDVIEFRHKDLGLSLDPNNLYDLGDDTAIPETFGDIGSLSPSDIAIPSIGSYTAVGFMEYIKYAIYNAFVPLTEVPLIYQYINGESYQPVNKKQVIRKANGDLLTPTTDPDSEFDIAPMAKRFSLDEDGNSVIGIQFTDFKLDGTSDNLYFYAIRESGSTMQMGSFSPILGPIKLVNTKPPKSPDIKRVMPVLENTILDVKPGVSIEINAYPRVQNIKKIRLYRTLDSSKSLAIRSMELIKTIDLTEGNQIDNNIWIVKDEFDDIGYVPYSDPLYYRITALREVEYVDKGNMASLTNPLITEYAPSLPSKLLISTVVESYNPESPSLTYSFDVNVDPTLIDRVILKWSKTVYNGKYHLYKMNAQGNWVKIHEFSSNLEEIQLLLSDTSLADGTLQIEDTEGKSIYHHFKVVAENSVGMLSTEDKIITIPNTINLDSTQGIGDMTIENTNIIR